MQGPEGPPGPPGLKVRIKFYYLKHSDFPKLLSLGKTEISLFLYRVILENQDCQEQKEQEWVLTYIFAFLRTVGLRIFQTSCLLSSGHFESINGIPLCCTVISRLLLLPLKFIVQSGLFFHLYFLLLLATLSTALVLIFLWYLSELLRTSILTWIWNILPPWSTQLDKLIYPWKHRHV